MKLVEVSAETVDGLRSRSGKWRNVIEEFLKSGLNVAEVTEYDGTLVAAHHGLHYAVKKGGYPAKVIRRKERIFLAREEQ